MELIEAVRTAAAAGELENVGEGRGIVFTAGNADTLTRVLYTMRVLRHGPFFPSGARGPLKARLTVRGLRIPQVYGSTLPAAVFHFPSERIADPDSPLLAELKELGCAVVEAVGTERDPGKTKSYHLKAIAIIESPWREVLCASPLILRPVSPLLMALTLPCECPPVAVLDSDNIPTRDPVYMFDAPGYKRLGAMFWPDFWKYVRGLVCLARLRLRWPLADRQPRASCRTGPMNPVWQIMGVKVRPHHSPFGTRCKTLTAALPPRPSLQCRDEWEQEAGQIFIDKASHLDALVLWRYMLENHQFSYFLSDGDKDLVR